MPFSQQRRLDLSKRLNYAFWIIMTLPFVVLGIVTGITELMLGTSGSFTFFVVKPFTWAYERKCGDGILAKEIL